MSSEIERLKKRVAELTQVNAQLQAEITKRNHIESELRQSETRYRELVEIQDDFLVCRWQPDTTLTFVNQAYCRYFGQEASQLLGTSFLDLIPDGSAREQTRRTVIALVQSPKVLRYEHQVVSHSGQIAWQRWVDQPLWDEQGNLLEFQSIGFDITERKEAEIAMKQAKEAAETANKAKGTFLANMSHELRTPLSVISGFTDIINRDPTIRPQHRERLQTIASSSEHLMAIINQVLDLSKIEAGQMKVMPTNFDFLHFLTEVKQLFEYEANKKKLRLVFRLAPNLPHTIHTDAVKLRQVLINLLSNAIKFTQVGQVILAVSIVEGSQKQNGQMAHCQLSFSVKDTGLGMTVAELDIVFDTFVQAEAGQQTRQGSGLGLSLSREFVKLMGGELTVESQLGKGSCFSFNLPVGVISPKKSGDITLFTDDISPNGIVFPDNLLADLRKACIEARIISITNLLETIEEYNPNFAQYLTRLADEYAYDQMIQLIDNV